MSALPWRERLSALPVWALVALIPIVVALGWLAYQLFRFLIALAIAFGGAAVGPL